MSERRLRFRIGLFVLIGLVLLAGLIYLFTSVPGAFRGAAGRQYVVEFDDATGVAAGTPVRRSGVKIGEVAALQLDEELGVVRVILRIDPNYQIRKHEQVTLSTGLLSNDTTLDLLPREEVPGQPLDRAPVDPNQTLKGVRAVNVNLLLARASEVVPPAQETLYEMKKSLQRLEKMQPLVEETIREYRDLARMGKDTLPEVKKLAQNMNEAVPEFKKVAENTNKSWPKVDATLEEVQLTLRNWNSLGEALYVFFQTRRDTFDQIIKNLDSTMQAMANILDEDNQKQIDGTIDNVHRASGRLETLTRQGEELMKDTQGTLRKIDRTADQASGAMDDVRKVTRPWAERGDSISRNLDESSARLNATLADVQALLKVIGRSEGSLMKFIQDPNLYNNLDDVAQMVGKVMPRVDRILRDLEVFADKIARHPESIGIRGAVRPGSGLKEAPSQHYQPSPSILPHR